MLSRIFLATLLCLFTGAAAEAGVLGSFLTFDGPEHHTTPPFQGGGEDELTDDSFAKYIDNGDTGFSEDDILFGMVSIKSVDASGRIPADSNIGLVFSFRFDSVDGDLVTLAAVGDEDNDHDLRKLLHSDIATPAGLTDESVFVLVSNPSTAMADRPEAFGKDTAKEDILEFNNDNGWMWDATAGLTGATDDFAEFTFGEAFGIETPDDFFGGFTIQSHSMGSSIVFLPVDIGHADGETITTHDIIWNSKVFVASGKADYNFEDQGTLLLNPVPEPSSFVFWIAMVAGGGLCARGRKRRT